jgi:ubiquinone/menaquinone biosynthesis C-methylase UbiE
MVEGFYDRYVLPPFLHLACGLKPFRMQRQKVIPRARGRVLEVGIGSGLNLPFYDKDRIEKVIGIDPSSALRAYAERAVSAAPFAVEFIEQPAERLALDEASIDTIVITYTLCTIPDTVAALSRMRRVLRPGGELLFCEHGQSPDEGVRRWQDRLTPAWRRIAGGCHLNRAIPELIKAGGFRIEKLETRYLSGWKPLTFNYWGVAVRGCCTSP